MAQYLTQNLVEVTLASAGINISQTTIPLATGEGAKLASTVGSTYQYPAVIYDSAYGAPHLDPNWEIVLITSHDNVTDTLAVATREAENSVAHPAVAHNTSGHTYKLQCGLTKAMFDTLGVNVREGGSSIVSPALGVNFDSDDFDISDEGSSIAGVKLSTLANVQFAPNVPFHSSLVASAGVSTTRNLSTCIFAIPLMAQVIGRVTFNVGNNTFGVNDQMCVGLYDRTGALLIDGLWKNIDVAGNKITTLASPVTIKSGQYFLAWSFNKTAGGAIYGLTLSPTIGDIPFLNATAVWFGKGATDATAGADGSAGLPATLGTKVAYATLDPINIVPVVMFETV